MRMISPLPACALMATLVSGGVALGQESPSVRRDPSDSRHLQLAQSDTARATRIGRLGFAYPPMRSADPDLTLLVQYVADGANRQCTATEVFTWPNIVETSERAKEIFLAFDQALHLKGYDAVQEDVKAPSDPEAAAAHKGILAYVAASRNVNADDGQIVFLWYFEGNSIHLALCRAKPKKEESDEE